MCYDVHQCIVVLKYSMYLGGMLIPIFFAVDKYSIQERKVAVCALAQPIL